MKREATVYVRNNGETPHRDRFDGEDFVIEPGQSLEMTVSCARLCFGFGEEDKSRALRRQGWMGQTRQLEDAKKMLANFSFHQKEPTGTSTLCALGSAEAAAGRQKRPAATPRNPGKRTPSKPAPQTVDEDPGLAEPPAAMVNVFDKLSGSATQPAAG